MKYGLIRKGRDGVSEEGGQRGYPSCGLPAIMRKNDDENGNDELLMSQPLFFDVSYYFLFLLTSGFSHFPFLLIPG